MNLMGVKKILQMRFGLNGERPLTLEVEQRIGLTRERVRQIESRQRLSLSDLAGEIAYVFTSKTGKLDKRWLWVVSRIVKG